MNSRILSLFAALLVFTGCGPQTFLMIAEGESFDALTKITDDKKISVFPNGGENGKSMVFSAKESDGSYNIYMKDNVLSSAVIQKTSGVNYNIYPNYCPANDKIAFCYFNKNNYDIYYINANSGKAITQITNTDENEYNPCWSPDGKSIVFEKGAAPKSFVQYRSGGSLGGGMGMVFKVTENQVWIKNLETGELKMIGQGSFPKFSPNGKEIVFVKYDINRNRSGETGTIWTMSIDGENQRQITNTDLGYATFPCWSPDGKNVAFQLTKRDKADSDIYTISTTGENLKQHTINKSNDFAPYWSKDNFLYFSSDRGSQYQKYLIWRFKISAD